MRTVHEQRRTALVESIELHLADKLKIIGADAGLHATARLVESYSDEEICERATESGIVVKALSDYDMKKTATKPSSENGLIFGFACSTPKQIRSAIKKLASLF